jgi:DNA polymerase
MKIDFHFDFEARSRADIKAVGAVRYATDPSTEATLLTWAMGRTGPVKYWRPGQEVPAQILDVAHNPSKYNFNAHNIEFDFLIWTIPFRKVIPTLVNPKIEDLTDNMSLSCHFRCGAGLDSVAAILGLPMSKDKEGRRVMLKQCKPNPRTGEFNDLTEQEWESFIRYGLLDTRILQASYYLMPGLSSPERFAWEWTFKRNMQGIRVDMPLVKVMNDIIEREKPKLVSEFDRCVGHKVKINSPKAKDWFKQYYPWVENMQADTIREMLMDVRPGIPAYARRALELKDLAGSTSLAKVSKILNLVYTGNIYQLLAYHYAQTKRWAGRGVQIQNFPRPVKGQDPIDFDLNQTDIASIVASKAPTLKDPLGFVKNLLRRVWLPSPGKYFYCGDWAKIEPTVLFWLVGLGHIPKNWYEDMAATIYNVEVDQIGKDSEERQLGKSAALGCLAEGTKIQTLNGLKNIEQISTEDLIWNGEKYVSHGGLSANGMKSVIRSEKLNIKSTPDHLFLTSRGWRTSVEMEVEEDTKPLMRDQFLEDGQLSDLSLRKASSAMSLPAAYVGLKRLFVWINSGEEGRSLVEAARTLLKPELIQSPTLAATWLVTQGLESVGTHVSKMQRKDARPLARRIGAAMELEESSSDSDPLGNFWNTLLRWMGLTNGGSRLTGLIMMDTMKPGTYELLANQLITGIATVYDIKDCGEDNFYQTENVIAHNCGYGMGHNKFRVDTFKKTGLIITEDLSRRAVYAYRQKYSAITTLWTQLEWAFKQALYGETSVLCNGKLHVMAFKSPKIGSKGIQVRLPSGSHLYYHDVMQDTDGLSYLSGEDGGVTRKKIYGGLLCEHVTSSTARDILVPSIYRLEQAGFKVLSIVHDEIWGEAEEGRGPEFERIMCINPSWCQDMRISAESKNGMRYLK